VGHGDATVKPSVTVRPAPNATKCAKCKERIRYDATEVIVNGKPYCVECGFDAVSRAEEA
jgi:formylmethanofuran dehydrogenase subunit E